jgi:hypothetical protein
VRSPRPTQSIPSGGPTPAPAHLVEVIDELRAWARARQLADALLTVLAVAPYALP